MSCLRVSAACAFLTLGNSGEVVSTIKEGGLSVVVDRFYEAAVLPDLWPRVLHETSLALGAEGAIMLAHPSATASAVYLDGIAELIDTFRLRMGNLRRLRSVSRGG